MIVCITGKAGSGKTTAIKFLSKAGYKTFEMDAYVHEIYKYNQLGYKQIKKHFGTDYVNNEEVDRKKLGKLVFNDLNELTKLNEIMIPLMQSKIVELRSRNELIFVELAIYINYYQKFQSFFDKVILISSNKKIENSSLLNKFSHLKKFPTKPVENPIKSSNFVPFHFDFYVDNFKNKKNLENTILKIAKKI